MEKDFARKLVKDTLQHSFEKERFIYLVKNLLNQIEDSSFNYRGRYIPDSFKPYINSYERIGKYNDGENRIDILIVYLNKETLIERARTMQRNFIAGYLEGKYGSSKSKDAALVAFVPPNSDDWRFSFVKIEYKLGQTAKGNIKAEGDFTPARRYSFLVGKNENSHTAQSRLVPLLIEDEHNPTLKEIEDAFGIEKVTKEFFEKYRQLFLNLKESLDEIVKKDKKIKVDFEAKNVDTVDFAKKLLGQIVFLYFLQKKGWFGVPRGKNWGEGDKQFLRHLFDRAKEEKKNYFNDFLEPMFYQALRYDRSADDDYFSQFDCKIPFLNGGLFDPMNDYDWINTDILLSNEIFSNNCKTKEGDTGTGILDVFDRYNFTVKEDEPLEKEVAVDPEMLGKVFENLLEVKDRKSKGTYYTPREIVHYMCQQSLINYLDTAINTAEKPVVPEKATQEKFFGPKEARQKSLVTEQYDCLVPKEDIELFVKYGDSRIENEIIARQKIENIKNGKQKTSNYKLSLPESIHKNARKIDDALKTIRVCDPAVGSGAFLVGMMHEIVNARTVLSACLEKAKDRMAYDFKRDAIRSCLYGVDIDPGAVEIAKLRLWLSLVVDEEQRETIQPLPNLDYKIVCGNSLLGVQRNLENWQDFSELERLKPLFFNETNARKKQEYKQQIDRIIAKVTKGHTEFDFNIYFSEVFHEKKGFDVVIANPPYVEHKKLKGISSQLKEKFQTYSGTTDLYVYFYEKGLNILKSQGIITFISSDKFFRTRYGTKLRGLLSKNRILQIIDFTDVHVFDALVASCIIIALKQSPQKEVLVSFADDSLTDFGSVDSFVRENHMMVEAKSLNESIWQLEDPVRLKVKNKIDEGSNNLKHLSGVNIFRGVTTGCNQAFVIDKKKADELVNADNVNHDIIKPLLQGRNIRKWAYKRSLLYLIFTRRGINLKKYPAIEKYLSQFKDQLEPGKGRKPGDYQWYEIQDNTAYYPEFEKEKIIWGLTADKWAFCYDNKKHYLPSNGYILTSESLSLKYLLALLNSKLMEFYFSFVGIMTAGGAYTLKRETVWEFPIKRITFEKQKPIVGLVDKILAITKDDDYLDNPVKQAKVKELEKQIDQMVYKLYGLTDEEIAVIENSVKV